MGADLDGPKEPCVRWRSRSPTEGASFGGLFGPFKSIGSLCCRLRCKRDRSVVSSSMYEKGSFSTPGRLVSGACFWLVSL